jgi:hypothetical protein
VAIAMEKERVKKRKAINGMDVRNEYNFFIGNLN